MFHCFEWRELIDMPTTTPILTEIFGSPNYIVYGAGGDIALPGAIEYQGLHSDNVWTELHDPIGGITMRDLPVPAVHINSRSSISPLRTDRSARSPAAIVRGRRSPPGRRAGVDAAQHGLPIARGFGDLPGRPLLARWDSEPAREVRAMPNVEYFAPWFRSEALIRSMSYDHWQTLSPHAQRICRYVVCDPERSWWERVSLIHAPPTRAHRAAQLEAMGELAAATYLRRT